MASQCGRSGWSRTFRGPLPGDRLGAHAAPGGLRLPSVTSAFPTRVFNRQLKRGPGRGLRSGPPRWPAGWRSSLGRCHVPPQGHFGPSHLPVTLGPSRCCSGHRFPRSKTPPPGCADPTPPRILFSRPLPEPAASRGQRTESPPELGSNSISRPSPTSTQGRPPWERSHCGGGERGGGWHFLLGAS